MAIGAVLYDNNFSYRKNAIAWVREAELWLSVPRSKSRLTVSGLQIMILLCIARETTGLGADLIWITVGSLLRAAISMGFHRDPKRLPRTSLFQEEIHRRLWNTILEVRQTTCPKVPPVYRSDAIPTAIALRYMLPVRLHVAKFLNDLNPRRHQYDEVIQLEVSLRDAYKQLCKSIQGLQNSSLSPFDSQFLDFIVRRYFLSLHAPWFGKSLQNAAFAHSRWMVVETATKIWHMVSMDGDLALFTKCAAGFFRSVPIQAFLSVAIEILTQLEEDESLGPKTLRPDLLAILHGSRDWSLARVETGSTNIKGYMLLCGLIAHIDARRQSLPSEEVHKAFARNVEGALHTCMSVLQGISQKERPQDEPIEVNDGWEMTGLESVVADVESFFTFAPGWLVTDTPPDLTIWQ
ncbi:hypothetical protein PFICI_14596 [Pestalotiopsis fici W106-1]|uniref:Xylanolytic transcriptional activator regulatory domain-containing protein n=1 Tax=Pestalotiopsis fici (strain W106-1 / CGMCC3.15140) TaxID=1229662 RepID=W3WI96_PESFW|nr:uncharacterized protein PFICI_14596 [Pestalotiopsis fici W106-1]ETS73650.1 hypothetical protein PFICI_14596 [Pestalotiopsis fici W106-1]